MKTLGEIHQPDNLETTANGSLLITEDPGSSQQFTLPTVDPNATTARLWRVPLGGGSAEVVAKVDQSTDEGPTDVDPSGPGEPRVAGSRAASWTRRRSSGRACSSSTSRRTGLWVEKADGPDVVAPAGPDWTFKREGGQLLLMKIPGA